MCNLKHFHGWQSSQVCVTLPVRNFGKQDFQKGSPKFQKSNIFDSGDIRKSNFFQKSEFLMIGYHCVKLLFTNQKLDRDNNFSTPCHKEQLKKICSNR